MAQVEDFDFQSAELIPLQPNEYVFRNKFRSDKKGNITRLDQEFYQVDGDDVYLIHESYKLYQHHWRKYRFKEIRYTTDSGGIDYYYQTDGYQVHYDSIGRPIAYNHYIEGEKSQLKRIIEYYPSGQIHFIMEIKDDAYWNVIDYYYPDGKPYDYGDFQNGEGQIIWLDETGNPCLICNMGGKKPKLAKILCEEEGKKKRKRAR